MVGVVLATFEIAILITVPVVSHYLKELGRKNFVVAGCILMILASVGFGLTVYIENDIGFFVVSIVLRFISGVGEACASSASLSIIGIEFFSKRE